MLFQLCVQVSADLATGASKPGADWLEASQEALGNEIHVLASVKPSAGKEKRLTSGRKRPSIRSTSECMLGASAPG